MRAEADEFEIVPIELTINQHQVRAQMTVTAIVPFAGQRMIEVTPRQLFIRRQQADGVRQQCVESFAVPSRLLAAVIAFELVGLFNRPHSAS